MKEYCESERECVEELCQFVRRQRELFERIQKGPVIDPVELAGFGEGISWLESHISGLKTAGGVR